MLQRHGVGALGKTRRERIKRSLLRKYGPICQHCFRRIELTIIEKYDPMHWSVDHIVRIRDGGSNEIENLRPMHRKCNEGRN